VRKKLRRSTGRSRACLPSDTDDPEVRNFDVLIVGTGHAGAQAAIGLRQSKFEGSIGLIGEEPDLPYERPPLSKAYLCGEKSADRLLIRPAAFWTEREIAFLLGRRAEKVDPDQRTVALSGGDTVAYGSLIWAAGGRARALSCSGADLAGVHSIRSRADVDALRNELAGARRVVIVGGGTIGLESAASLTKLGKPVVLVEALGRVLVRSSAEPVSRFFEAEHRAHGVDIRLDTVVDCITGHDGRVAAVRLRSGEELPADIVVVGIGIAPVVEVLAEAGAATCDGVEVDSHMRTSLAGIFAIGDCARHENAFAGGARIRLESVQNANDQAQVVVAGLTGSPRAYDAIPWFWSDQYDLKLRSIGLSIGHDAAIVRGDPATRSFSIVYLREGRVIALDCLNNVRDYVQGRLLVQKGLRIDPARLADAGTPLKSLAE
jgi:3-phenylpropionate/trans-cinnamate dioxygenase ferredoxin reductase subunit